MLQSSKLKTILLIIFLTIMVPGLFTYLFYYTGSFNQVTIKKTITRDMTIIGFEEKGDYQKSGKHISRMRHILAKYNITCIPAIIYYNNPHKVIKKLLNSLGGCLVLPEHKKKIHESYHTIKKADSQKIRIHHIPEREAIEASIEAHPSIALTKSFRRMDSFSKQNHILHAFPRCGIFHAEKVFFYMFLKRI